MPLTTRRVTDSTETEKETQPVRIATQFFQSYLGIPYLNDSDCTPWDFYHVFPQYIHGLIIHELDPYFKVNKEHGEMHFPKKTDGSSVPLIVFLLVVGKFRSELKDEAILMKEGRMDEINDPCEDTAVKSLVGRLARHINTLLFAHVDWKSKGKPGMPSRGAVNLESIKEYSPAWMIYATLTAYPTTMLVDAMFRVIEDDLEICPRELDNQKHRAALCIVWLVLVIWYSRGEYWLLEETEFQENHYVGTYGPVYTKAVSGLSPPPHRKKNFFPVDEIIPESGRISPVPHKPLKYEPIVSKLPLDPRVRLAWAVSWRIEKHCERDGIKPWLYHPRPSDESPIEEDGDHIFAALRSPDVRDFLIRVGRYADARLTSPKPVCTYTLPEGEIPNFERILAGWMVELRRSD